MHRKNQLFKLLNGTFSALKEIRVVHGDVLVLSRRVLLDLRRLMLIISKMALV